VGVRGWRCQIRAEDRPPNTTGIQVRQLLFFGGNLASESVHAAMIC